MKFKVGDKVIANKNGASRGKNEPYMKGKEYTLRYVFKDDTVGLEGFDNICEKADFDLKPTSIFDGLIEGEYYRYQYDNRDAICICSESNTYKVNKVLDRINRSYRTHDNKHAAKSVHPATPEERQWLDACIAAGKYVDKPEKWLPKVGDWVVRTKEMNGPHNIGKIFKVSELTPGGDGAIEYEGKREIIHCIRSLRKALPHEIPKQESSHMHDAVRYMCKTIIQPSNNLTPDKNEHKTEKFEVQRPNFSIPTASAGRGERFDRTKSKVRFGSDDCHYQKGSSTSEKGFRKR